MAYEPKIEVLDDHILVSHVASEGGNAEPPEFASELAEACDKANIHRVLLDERNLVYTVGNIFDLMGLGDKLVEEMLVFRFHRVACVTTEEQLPTAKDFEAVARNRGMNYRAFETLEEAKEWLLGE